MDSTKQENVSRQSSILKPPKQRQPLQCVATNPSSSENSPTIKIKRRVSFAKNKRIREFCNEAEQGTVWDDTYEEHDLSNTKNSSNGNDHPVIITVPCDDKENFPVQLFLQNDQLTCKEIPASVLCEEGDNLSQCDMEMDNSINNFGPSNIRAQNKQMEYPNATIYCDDGMDITTYAPSEIIPCHNREADCFNDTVPVSQTCIQDASMDITQNLPFTLYRKSMQDQTDKSQLDTNKASNSTDLTQAISTLFTVGCSNKLTNRIALEHPNHNRETYKDKIDCSNSTSIEFTSILPSSTWIRPNSRCQNEEKTENLTNTMEFTMAVPYTNHNNQNVGSTIGILAKTNILPNKSMEMTEPVNNKIKQFVVNANPIATMLVPEETKIYSNNSMEMTEAVSIRNKINHSDNNTQYVTNMTTQEKTKIFSNNSMEMTEAVPIRNKINHSDNNTQYVTNMTTQEKTKIFSNNSMEMTEAVPIRNKINHSDNNTQYVTNMATQEKTKIFSNNSMEMTEAVPIRNKINHSDNNTQYVTNMTTQEKTKIFSNNSMEMTEAVPIRNIINHSDNNTQYVTNMATQEKTKIFSNNSMEMTEAVPIRNKINHSDNNTQHITNTATQERTKIFSNNSMEMTEAVPVYKNFHQFTLQTDKTLLELTGNGTKIFDKSMEVTQPIQINNKIHQSSTTTEILREVILNEKTNNFSNMSIDMTEIGNKSHKRSDSLKKSLYEEITEKTKIFSNVSMEMTEAVPICNKIYHFGASVAKAPCDTMQEKTKILFNKSMEITESAPILHKIHHSDTNAEIVANTLMQEKTKFSTNTSIEMSQAVPVTKKVHPSIVHTEKPHHELTQNQTKIFVNKSMEITEALPICHNIHQSSTTKKKISHEAAQEKTNILCTNSMEMTEAVPIYNKIYQCDTSTNKIQRRSSQRSTPFYQKSLDFVPIPIEKDPVKLTPKEIKEKLSLIFNTSKEGPKSFPKYMQIHEDMLKPPAEEKLLEGIPIYKQIQQFLNENKEIPHRAIKESLESLPNKSLDVNNMVTTINHPSADTQKISHEVTQDKTKIFLSKSMDVSETIPIYQGIVNANAGSSNVQNSEIEEKTKIVHNKLMELTEAISMHPKDSESNELLIKASNDDKTEYFLNKSMDITENIPVQQKIFSNTQHKMLNNTTQEKTRIFINKSMDVSETIPIYQGIVNANTGSNNVQNSEIEKKTKVVHNKSMEITEAISMHPKVSESNELLIRASNDDKTEYFLNKSMDITENIPVQQKIFSNIQHKMLNNTIQENTRIFINKSMDVSETIPIYQGIVNAIAGSSNVQNSETEEKTKIVHNKSMEITESISMGPKVSKTNDLLQRVSNDEKTEYYLNKSMDITENIPIKQNIFSNTEQVFHNTTQEKTIMFPKKSMNVSETIQEQNIATLSKISSKMPNIAADDTTKVVCNKSMDITKIVPQHRSACPDLKIDIISTKVAQDKTKIFVDKSMNVTETMPIHQQISVLTLNNQKGPCEITQEKTTIFMDKSMIMTETMAAYKNNSISTIQMKNVPSEAAQLFRNVSTLPSVTNTYSEPVENAHSDYIQNVTKNTEGKRPNTEITKIYHDASMELTSGLPISQTIGIGSDIQCKIINAENKKSDNTLEMVPSNVNTYNRLTSLQNPIEIASKLNMDEKIDDNSKYTDYHDKTKVFHDASMDFTSVPSTLRSATKISKTLNDYNDQSILSNRVDATQNSINASNNFHKRSNYEISDRFSSREETFHRITSDELNTLCASMNLPTQKYPRDESVTVQNNYISSCNDVNVLRDSLKRNSIFQEEGSAVKNNALSETDRNLHITATNCENFDKENISSTACGMDIKEQSLVQPQREETNNIPTIMDFSVIDRNTGDKSALMQNNKSITIPVIEMETDKTAEISLKYPGHQQASFSSAQVLRNSSFNTSRNSRYIDQPVTQKNVLDRYNKMPIDEVIMHDTINVSSQNVKSLCITKQNSIGLEENLNIHTTCKYSEQENLANRLQISHDASMEFKTVPSTVSIEKRPKEMYEPVDKNNAGSNIVECVYTSMEVCRNSDKGKDCVISRENSLSRLPSDNTDVLIATMGFKTKLTYPLIINDKTTITVSRKSLANKTYTIGTNEESHSESNKPYIVDTNTNMKDQNKSSNLIDNQVQNENENLGQNCKIPIVENDIQTNDIEEECDSSDKENKEPSVRVNLFPEEYSELEEIQPPSFLGSDSMQDDLIGQIEMPNNSHLDSVSSNLNKQNTNVLLTETEDNMFLTEVEDSNQFSARKLRRLSSSDSNCLSKKIKKNNETLFSREGSSRPSPSPEICKSKEDPAEKLLTPFLSLTENIKVYEKRDDCIWVIRSIKPNMIAIDFITKSFVIIIRLNETEKDCIKDIEKIEFISRIRADSKNILLKIVHQLLLSKLNPNELLEKYKMYEDVLPMLEHVSMEIVFAMNFMFDLERLSAMNLLSIDNERILFMVSSRKSNIILKVSLIIKIFNEIGPNDIDVTCVLGDIRKSDIKQLIVNIKRDYKFLSRYINDVKDYITLMEESTCLNKQ